MLLRDMQFLTNPEEGKAAILGVSLGRIQV